MKFFGLTPPETASTPLAGSRALSLGGALVYGSLSFGAVSALAYSIWAFKWVPGTVGLYTTTALVYIGLGGLALSRLVLAPGRWKRFPLLFAAGFFLYAVGWCVFWFGLKGKHYADLWGAMAGLACMTWLFQRAFGKQGGFFRLFVVLLICHSIGYYIGGELYAQVRGSTGRLLWGAAHGLGFGAGLGYLLYHCQTTHRAAHS